MSAPPNPPELRHLAVVTGNYPTPFTPHRGTFVHQTVHALARAGVECTVVHPIGIHEVLRHPRLPRRWEENEPTQAPVRVCVPPYLSCTTRRLGPLRLARWTVAEFGRATTRELRRCGSRPDAVYGHFLLPSGVAAAQAGERLGLPAFAGVGESTFWGLAWVGAERAARLLRDVAGYAAVSSQNARAVCTLLGVPETAVKTFPNGVDLRRFHPRDQTEMRRRHGLPADTFLAIFVGQMNERKGVLRVDTAAAGLEGVQILYLGHGSQRPQASNARPLGPVPHDSVPELLCAADAFVLPTLAEGFCNAAVEAMACGLPVIGSDRAFNDGLLTEENSIRVNPLDTGALRAALVRLRDEPETRRAMGRRAAEKARREFDLDSRIARLKSWMEQRISTQPARSDDSP